MLKLISCPAWGWWLSLNRTNQVSSAGTSLTRRATSLTWQRQLTTSHPTCWSPPSPQGCSTCMSCPTSTLSTRSGEFAQEHHQLDWQWHCLIPTFFSSPLAYQTAASPLWQSARLETGSALAAQAGPAVAAFTVTNVKDPVIVTCTVIAVVAVVVVPPVSWSSLKVSLSCSNGPAVGVGVAEWVVRIQAAGPLQQYVLTGRFPRRPVHCDGGRRWQGGH